MTKSPPTTVDLGSLSSLAPELARTFVSIASDIALVIDPSGVIRHMAVGESVPAETAEEWVGKPWVDTVTGDTRRKIELLLQEAGGGTATRRREVSHPSQQGGDIPVAWAAIRLGDNGPVLAVGRDLRAVAAIQQRFMDAQREMERDYWQRRRVETRYRMLFQVATDAVLVVDATTLAIVEANRAASQLFGRPAEDLVGQSPLVCMVGPSRPGVEALLVSARTTGRPAEMRAFTAPGDEPLLHATQIDLSATPFRADDSMLLLVRARAVEPANDALMSTGRLADFVEKTPDAVVITDSAGRVLMANPSFAEMAKADNEGATLGRPLAELLGDPQQALQAILAEARRQGVATRRLAVLGHDDSRRIEAEITAALLAEGDQECLGLTLRRAGTASHDLPPQVGALAAAIDTLATQVGLVTLPELLQEASDLAERHLIEAALARSGSDRLQAAQLLGISAESLWLRMRHHRLGGKPGSDGAHSNMLN
jgi:transcriptional regulator PpsR